MVLEKLVGEKFMIPCQNIHPWQCFNINAPFIFIKDGAKIDEVRGAKVGELEATIKKHKY